MALPLAFNIEQEYIEIHRGQKHCGVNIPEKKHIAEKQKTVQKYERITFQKGTYPSLFHGTTLF